MKILACNSNRPLAEAIAAYLNMPLTRASGRRFSHLEIFCQIPGFSDIPTDNLFTAPVFVKDMQERYKGERIMMVSPDVGGVLRARAIAKRVDADLAIIDKRRERAGASEVMNIIGEVKGRVC